MYLYDNQEHLVKRRRWLIVIAIVVVLGVVGLAVSGISKKSTQNTGAESVGPGTVVIDNTNSLLGGLLSSQYTAVNNELVSYIQSKYGDNTEHAALSDTPPTHTADNGNITFKVLVDGQSMPFTVELDRNNFEYIVFMVKETGYTKKLQVYGSDNAANQEE